MVVIYFILVFGSIILIHELGHLLAAKYFNVYCEEFAFGMGPKLVSKKYKETTYSLRLLPIGGFVAMAGEADADFDQSGIPYERTIKGISKWKQIIVMLAGVFMNFVLALILFTTVNLVNREIRLPAPPIIHSVNENSVAEEAGFLANDEVIEVTYPSGNTVYPKEFSEIGMYFPLFENQEVRFKVKRDSGIYDLIAVPKLDEESQRFLIGITGTLGDIKELSTSEAIVQGFKDFKSSSTLIMDGFKFLVQGVGMNQLSGPIGIIDQTDQIMDQAQSFSQSVNILMILIATFSVNLGIVNLFPLPMFDGGRVIITLFEIITRKNVNEKVETALMLGSFVFIIALLLLTTYNDISRILFR